MSIEVVFWICVAILLVSSAVATFASDLRVSILALWLTGLAAGGIFLSRGAELLAVIQWIVSTLVAISFIFYSISFGEYGVNDPRSRGERLLSATMPVLSGVALAWMIWLGTSHLNTIPVSSLESAGQDLATVGKAIANDHFLSLELLAITLLLVVVGAGVIARPEAEER